MAAYADSWIAPHTAAFARVEKALSSFDVGAYALEARARGRSRLSHETRNRAGELYDSLSAFRSQHDVIPRRLDETLELAIRVLGPEHALQATDLPRYRAYTNLAVLNWYLKTTRRIEYQAIWRRCARAIVLLLDDLISFETMSLLGLETRGLGSFQHDAVRERTARLEEIRRSMTGKPSPRIRRTISRPPAAWQSYLDEPGNRLALTELTAFPLTEEHDEYAFLRTLHISECCFWGVLTASLAATEALKRQDAVTAKQCLLVALSFARPLTPVLRALKTMDADQFDHFRDAIRAGSALQSRTYHLMQIALTGTHPATIDTVAGVDELHHLRHYDHAGYLTLSDVAAEHCWNPARHEQITGVIDELSRELRMWRKLHRGIARTYLGDRPQGTGGTSGAAYLKHTVDVTVAAEMRQPRQASHRLRARDLCAREPFHPRLTERALPVLGVEN